MSEYHSQTTKWKDADCVVEGLIAAGYDRSVIEVHDQPVQLYDYQRSPTRYIDKTGDKANIIIRRHNIGYSSANDVGFKFNTTTGTYDAIVSEFDSSARNWGVNSTRMAKAKDGYTEARTMKTATQQGFKFLGRKVVIGKTQLQFLDPRSI